MTESPAPSVRSQFPFPGVGGLDTSDSLRVPGFDNHNNDIGENDTGDDT